MDLLYKCLKCGEEVREIDIMFDDIYNESAEIHPHDTIFNNFVKFSSGISVWKNPYHVCKNGKIGLITAVGQK